MKGSIIFIDETLVGLYRKALNRHLKGDLFYCWLSAVDTRVEWLSNDPECNYDKVLRDDEGEDETLRVSIFRTFSRHANKGKKKTR